MEWISPQTTQLLLALVLALHLLHHRLAKRHISFAEVITAAVLLVPPIGWVPGLVLMAAHIVLIGIQVAGSIWIDRLSPDWEAHTHRGATVQ